MAENDKQNVREDSNDFVHNNCVVYMDVARDLVALSTPVDPFPVKPVHLPLFDQSLRLARE